MSVEGSLSASEAPNVSVGGTLNIIGRLVVKLESRFNCSRLSLISGASVHIEIDERLLSNSTSLLFLSPIQFAQWSGPRFSSITVAARPVRERASLPCFVYGTPVQSFSANNVSFSIPVYGCSGQTDVIIFATCMIGGTVLLLAVIAAILAVRAKRNLSPFRSKILATGIVPMDSIGNSNSAPGQLGSQFSGSAVPLSAHGGHCSWCGTTSPQSVAYCINCGTRLPEELELPHL